MLSTVSRDIPEADWKVFRQLQPLALERFCERVLSEIRDASSVSGQTAHQRYLQVFEIVRYKDKDLAALFDNPRRSTARLQLSLIHSHGLLTPDEVKRFSSETQQMISALADTRT
jgi:hypothetical protein